MKVLITTSTFAKFDKRPIEILQEKGIEILKNPFGRKITKEESFDLYSSEVDGVIAGTEMISRELLSKTESLKVISRCGIGLDGVDLEAAKEKGIKVFITLDPVVIAVAELTVGLMLDCLRNISKNNLDIKNGIWQKPMGSLLKDKVVGIVGLGNIGKRVVGLCKNFGCKFVAFDINRDETFANEHNLEYLDLDSLLKESDIVSIHLSLTEETRNLISKEKLNLMKPSSFLVNTSRGSVVDEDALVEMLKEKKIAGVALDVFEKEPYEGPLQEIEEAILTSHIGSYAREARIEMERLAVSNLIEGLGI